MVKEKFQAKFTPKTVRELTEHIKSLLDNDYLLANVWVKGEISNFKQAVSGHLYFTLKDEFSSLKVVMFRSRAGGLSFRPDNGMAVAVRGYISVYEREGAYQLYAAGMEPDGIGALYVAFERLKERLRQEGLFEPGRKKPLPFLPGCIGIVTSPAGAAVRDMVGIIRRRWPGTEIILFPAAVQGETAPQEITAGVNWLNRLGRVEVIIVGRGGGSLEELWAFNTEEVARGIFESKIPVISAVGHETDFTIADMVADRRAATPSAAAELAVPDKQEVEKRVGMLQARLWNAGRESLNRCRRRLENCLQNRFWRQPQDCLCGARQQALDYLRQRLEQGARRVLGRDAGRLEVLASRLNTLSPLATLARGYSICTLAESGRVVGDAAGVKPGDKLSVRLHRGKLLCVVENKLN
ncbi:MAG: exodeoxyribonuclease VII large subunit [Peptococcaceae bacterium]|nr:MAG: exodeoxyribonuclease VII large subunit [Peptococcaceae bacterium]